MSALFISRLVIKLALSIFVTIENSFLADYHMNQLNSLLLNLSSRFAKDCFTVIQLLKSTSLSTRMFTLTEASQSKSSVSTRFPTDHVSWLVAIYTLLIFPIWWNLCYYCYTLYCNSQGWVWLLELCWKIWGLQ